MLFFSSIRKADNTVLRAVSYWFLDVFRSSIKSMNYFLLFVRIENMKVLRKLDESKSLSSAPYVHGKEVIDLLAAILLRILLEYPAEHGIARG
jgi:hypothetical protein